MADSTKVFPPGFRAEDDNGIIIAGGTLEFFAGGTSDPLEVFSNKELTVSLGTTVELNAGGYPVSSGGTRVIVYTGTDPYRIRLKDDDGVVVWEHDDVQGALDTGDFDDLIAASFAPGTSMLFVQTNAPTGWTKSVAHNDKALRIVSGTASDGGSGPFSSVFGARTILQANLPNYTLAIGTLAIAGSQSGGLVRALSGDDFAVQGGVSRTILDINTIPTTTLSLSGGPALNGSGTAMDFAVQYVDCINATRD